MIWAQLRTKTRTSISREICYVKSGFEILYAVERFSSLFSKDKLKAKAGTHTSTHDPPSPRLSLENCLSVPRLHTCVVWSWGLKECFALASEVGGLQRHGFSSFIGPKAMPCLWTPITAIRAKQLSIVATAWLLWLWKCVGWCMCFPCLYYFRSNLRLCNRIKFNLFFIHYCN